MTFKYPERVLLHCNDAPVTMIDREGLTKLQEIMAIGGVVSPDKVVAYEAIVASDVALQAQRSLPPK
jgi:hypothetical protein